MFRRCFVNCFGDVSRTGGHRLFGGMEAFLSLDDTSDFADLALYILKFDAISIIL